MAAKTRTLAREVLRSVKDVVILESSVPRRKTISEGAGLPVDVETGIEKALLAFRASLKHLDAEIPRLNRLLSSIDQFDAREPATQVALNNCVRLRNRYLRAIGALETVARA